MPNRMQGHTSHGPQNVPERSALQPEYHGAATGIRCRRQMFRQQNYSAMQTLTRFSSTLAKG